MLQVTADGGPSIGESPDVRGLWYCESVSVKDAPGTAKILADWMTDGRTEFDHHAIDIARYYPFQKTEDYIRARCYETAFKIYNPPVHNCEPYTAARNVRRSPFWERERALGAHFMEAAGWERAHGYASNAHLLEKYADRVPERHADWDNRHFWWVSNAEQLEISENVGMVNLAHFAIYDVSGPDAEVFMEYVCVAKVGGDTQIGKGIYTHFLDAAGGIRADLTVVRTAPAQYRVMDGGDSGNRDFVWMKRLIEDHGLNATIQDRTEDFVCIGRWGPNARATLEKMVADSEGLSHENVPFVRLKEILVDGTPVSAFRISYVGEQGWELHCAYDDGLTLWDALYAQGVTPVGVETYASSRRLEKSLRLQNADLLMEYNLLEAGLARPKVKAADFVGKAAYLAQRERAHQPAYLCTLTMQDNIDANGVARYPVGSWPIMDPQSGAVLLDAQGRRSFITSIAYGPSIGKNIALAYLPFEYCQEGRHLVMEYFSERYPLRAAAVGYEPL